MNALIFSTSLNISNFQNVSSLYECFSTVLFTLKAFMKAIPASWKFRKDLASSFEQDICEGYS